MAQLYKKLQKALSSYEDRPEEMIIESKLSDSAFIIRGKDHGMQAWHFVLVPADKLAAMRAHPADTNIDLTKFGSVLQYRNHQGGTVQMSGWGRNPPKMIEMWINEHYGRASIDQSISLIYEQDDIRLCTMQRAIPEQRLGISCDYDKRLRFHFIKLTEDLQSTLAIRAGIKNYDRMISLNGVNIEHETFNQLMDRFDLNRDAPVQMLVCSPATYIHYKTNKKRLHSDLPTVQRLKPVYATSTSDSDTDTPAVSIDKDSFCVVERENTNMISIVPQLTIFKSPDFTRVNDICIIETENQYQKGKILLIGSYSDCKNLKKTSTMKTDDTMINVDTDVVKAKSASLANTPDVCLTFEQLPNELFFHIFTYLDLHPLYNAFSRLNTRINNLFQSYENLCLIFDKKTNPLFMKSCAPYITRLVIDTSSNCDLTQFPNLQSLILCDSNSKHLNQIRPSIVPNLAHLSFLLGSKFIPSSQLVHDVFCNVFPSLHHINLGRIVNLEDFPSWSSSPSLRFVSIRCDNPLIVSLILGSCENLDHLQVHIFQNISPDAFSSPPPNHPLRRFTLWSDSIELTPTDLDTILVNTPNVEHFYLQTESAKSFINLADIFINHLNHLSRFDCHVKEMIPKEHRIGDSVTVHQLHPSFNRIKCLEETNDFRIFGTK